MNVDERSDARERALHLLYEAQSKGISVEEVIGAQVVEPDELVLVLARGAELASNRADELIEGKSQGWTSNGCRLSMSPSCEWHYSNS